MPYSHFWYILHQVSPLPWTQGALHFLLYMAWNLVFSDYCFSLYRFTGLFCLLNGKNDQVQLKAKFCSLFLSHFGPCKGWKSEIGLLSLQLHCYTSAALQFCLWRDDATARPVVKGSCLCSGAFPECSPCIDRKHSERDQIWPGILLYTDLFFFNWCNFFWM